MFISEVRKKMQSLLLAQLTPSPYWATGVPNVEIGSNVGTGSWYKDVLTLLFLSAFGTPASV